MLNHCILVGKIETITETEKGADIKLQVKRPYKNKTGDYDTDTITTRTENREMIENLKAYCSIGDLVGIKGHFETETSNNGIITTYIVIEKLTFLSSNKE